MLQTTLYQPPHLLISRIKELLMQPLLSCALHTYTSTCANKEACTTIMGDAVAILFIASAQGNLLFPHSCSYLQLLYGQPFTSPHPPKAWKVDQVPGAIDQKVVDALRLSCKMQNTTNRGFQSMWDPISLATSGSNCWVML